MARPDDYADKMYSDDAAEHLPARSDSGGLRCAVFQEVCKTSREFEALAAERALEDVEVEFVEADGEPPVDPLIDPPSDDEICQFREHFSDAEWCVLMGEQSC